MKPIIADLVLPDIDGLTLLKRARELRRVVKTLIRNQCTLNDQMQEYGWSAGAMTIGATNKQTR